MGMAKGAGVSEYDLQQLELKRLKKEGSIPKRGPSPKPDFKKKKPRIKKKEAPPGASEVATKSILESDNDEDEDEETKRMKKIQKKLAADEEADVGTVRVLGQAKVPQKPPRERRAWKEMLKEKLEGMEDCPCKENLEKLLGYENVPLKLKPAKFKNFVRESLALFGADMAPVIDEMWEVFAVVVK